jgi:hypothetical protein
MDDHWREGDEDKGMRVICYVICAISVSICILLLIYVGLRW